MKTYNIDQGLLDMVSGQIQSPPKNYNEVRTKKGRIFPFHDAGNHLKTEECMPKKKRVPPKGYTGGKNKKKIKPVRSSYISDEVIKKALSK